MERERESFFFF